MANQPKKYQKFVATAATATLVATAVVPAASADTQFSDISTYATEVQEEVLFLADLGVITGFADGTFKPSQNITRGQAVKMIGRFLVEQGVTEVPENWETEQSFSDIALDRTDRDLVKYAAVVKEAGVFQGNGNVLNPSGFTTRENMALILDRLIGEIVGKTAVELAAGKTNNVSDLANAKEEAREAIAALNALGVSNAEEFKPKNNTQRVHFASFLARLLNIADELVTKVDSVTVIDEKTIEVVFKTGEETETIQFALETALVEGANEVTVTHNGVEYTLNVNYSPEAVVEAEVSSIKAINASELEVVFTAPVTAVTAEDKSNYEIKINNETVTAEQIVDINLSEDGKVATILFDQDALSFQNGDKYVVQTKDAITSSTGNKVEKFVTEEIVFAESASPVLENIEKAGDSLTFTFDRPVDAKKDVTLIKVDGIEIGSNDLAPVYPKEEGSQVLGEAGVYEYTVAIVNEAAKQQAKKVGTHEVVIFDAFDTAEAYAANASVITGSYIVSDTVVAPEVIAVEAVNANRFFLYTNVPVSLEGAELTVKKGTHQFKLDNTVFSDNTIVAGQDVTVTDASVGNYKNKPGVWVVVSDNNGNVNEENPLYRAAEATVELEVTLEKFTADSLTGKKAVQKVTLTKNNTKPAVKTTVVKNEKSLDIVFTNALVKADGAELTTLAAADYVVRDNKGIIIEGFTVEVSSDKKTISFVAPTGKELKDAPYSVEFKANKIKNQEDRENVRTYLANTLPNDVFAVTVGKDAESNFKYTELALVPGENVKVSPADNTIEIDFGVKMSDSARKVENYLLDGKALPAGTTVDFIGDTENVRIVFPEGTFKTSTSYKLGVSTNVTTEAGSIIVGSLQTKAPADVVFQVTDNVKPTLASALYYVSVEEELTTTTKSDKVEVTFSEAIKAPNTEDAWEDIAVVINGSRYDVTAIAPVTTGTNKENKLILTLEEAVNVNQEATITIVPEANQVLGSKEIVVTDIVGNKAVENSTVTLSAGAVKFVSTSSNENNQEDAVPEVNTDTVKLVADAAVGTIASLNGTVDEPLAGVKTVTILNSTLPAEFTGTVNGLAIQTGKTENGTTTIRVNTADELPLTSEIVIKDVNRIAVAGKEVSVTLFPTDDLATLKGLAEGELTTDAATATIQTPDGNTVKVDLSKADAIETIFATLTANNVTVADLIEGGSYTVELANEKGEKTTYTIKF